ncbi:MAG TPA: ROK family protein [Candidatus Binatia bacterium]|nr:ROK family protein [Candidatus Binatia bacterium]
MRSSDRNKRKTFTALGIDVGGTKIAAGLINFPVGEVVAQHTISTGAKRGGEAVLRDVVELAERLSGEAEQAKLTIAGIGIGLCEIVDPSGGILSNNCIPWKEAQVREALERFGPVFLEADVRAAARAESLFGAGRRFSIFLYVTVGTGISSCLMIDGSPYLGARGATGTMASSPVSVRCDECGGVNKCTLEDIASGPALVTRYDRLKRNGARTGNDVMTAAVRGNTDALSVVRSAGEALGSVVGLLINVLDPEALIVGGGLGLSEGPYWESFLDSTRRHVWSEVHREVPILRAQTGQNAGVIGAAAVAWKHCTSTCETA